MRSAPKANVLRRMVAAVAKRVTVMELEMVTRRAPAAQFVHEPAAALVSRVHRPPDRRRDVPRGGGDRRVGGDGPSGGLGLAEAAGFEPFELLRDGLLDERREIAVGHGGEHERPEPLELVVELGTRGELDLVASRSDGLDPRGARGRWGSSSCVRTQFERRGGLALTAGSPRAICIETRRRDDDLPIQRVRPPTVSGCRAQQRRTRRHLWPSRGQLSHEGRHVGTGCQHGDQLLDLAFGLVLGTLQELLAVLRGEVGSQLCHPREM